MYNSIWQKLTVFYFDFLACDTITLFCNYYAYNKSHHCNQHILVVCMLDIAIRLSTAGNKLTIPINFIEPILGIFCITVITLLIGLLK